MWLPELRKRKKNTSKQFFVMNNYMDLEITSQKVLNPFSSVPYESYCMVCKSTVCVLTPAMRGISSVTFSDNFGLLFCVFFLSANEIVQAANHEADKIRLQSEAARDKELQNSYVTAYQGLFSHLNVTKEEHKLSLLMIRNLEDAADNLYAGYGYDEHWLYSP